MATWLYLGNLADLDPTEGDASSVSENAGTLVGQSWDNTELSFVSTSYDDQNGDGSLSENPTTETITVDGVPLQLDSIQAYDATVLLGDGSTLTVPVGIAQMTDGSTYLIPSTEADLDNLNIQSIEIITLLSAGYVGMNTTSAARSIDNSAIVCFAAGTLVETPQGVRPVQDLRSGDLVTTLDHGPRILRWSGGLLRLGIGRAAPVRIAAGAFGPGLPQRDVLISRQHRVLLSSWFAKLYFGEAQILVPAVRLVGLPGITCQPQLRIIAYHHLLLDAHQVILAEGLPSESLFASARAIKGLPPEARREILALMPHLGGPDASPRPARLLVPGGDVPRARAQRFFRRALRPKVFDLFTRSAPSRVVSSPLVQPL